MKTVKIRLRPNNKQNTKLHQCARASLKMFQSCGYCFYCGKETVEVGRDYVKIQKLFPRDVCCYIRLAEKERVVPGNYPAVFFFDGFCWYVLIHMQTDAVSKRMIRTDGRREEPGVIDIKKLYKKQARLQRAIERKKKAAGEAESESKKRAQQKLRKVQNLIRCHHSGI